MNQREPSSAPTIELQSAGLADRLASSRKMRSERNRYQGFAKRCNPVWSAGASFPSTSWLYERKAS
jgi:hypothetical protein